MKCAIRAPSEAKHFDPHTLLLGARKDMALACFMELETSPCVTREGAPPPPLPTLPFHTSFAHPPGGHRGPGHCRRNPGLLPVGGHGASGFFCAPCSLLGPRFHPLTPVPRDRRVGASEIRVVCPLPPLAMRLRRRFAITPAAPPLVPAPQLAECSSHVSLLQWADGTY